MPAFHPENRILESFDVIQTSTAFNCGCPCSIPTMDIVRHAALKGDYEIYVWHYRDCPLCGITVQLKPVPNPDRHRSYPMGAAINPWDRPHKPTKD